MSNFYWHHRTIRYIDSNNPDDEPVYKAHEFSYEAGADRYDGFTFADSVAQSENEAESILDAFKHPPAVEADYATAEKIQTPFGGEQYTFNYKWLNREVV